MPLLGAAMALERTAPWPSRISQHLGAPLLAAGRCCDHPISLTERIGRPMR
jgi:hypothetical protein